MMPSFAYVRPASLASALEHLAEEGSLVHAGGTDLHGCIQDEVLHPKKIVSLSALDELTGIADVEGGGLAIGARTTIAEIAAHEAVRERYPAVAQAASEVASPQLRNQGTLGGNLCQKTRCSYYRGDFRCLRKGGTACFAMEGENAFHAILGAAACVMVHPSDLAPALAALSATATTVGGEAGGRRIGVDALHVPADVDPTRETVLEPGEILTHVVLPPPTEGLRSRYRKVRARRSWDFALAGAALAIAFDGSVATSARIFLAGVAPVPWRAVAAEKALVGKTLTGDVIRAAAQAAVEGAEPLSDNAYKAPLVQGILQEELEAIRP